MSLRLKIILAAAIGCLVPIVCFFVQMLFFSARENTWWIDFLTRRLTVIVCPACALDDGAGFWMIVVPLLNAAVYAGIVIVWGKLRPNFIDGPNVTNV